MSTFECQLHKTNPQNAHPSPLQSAFTEEKGVFIQLCVQLEKYASKYVIVGIQRDKTLNFKLNAPYLLIKCFLFVS